MNTVTKFAVEIKQKSITGGNYSAYLTRRGVISHEIVLHDTLEQARNSCGYLIPSGNCDITVYKVEITSAPIEINGNPV